MASDRHQRSNGQGQGQKWIRNERRLALYLRDGLACCYCGSAVEDGVRLTLDHLLPHSHGGDNSNSNLVTACLKCNSARGNRDWQGFAATVAQYLNHDITAADIIGHIETTSARPVQLAAAKQLIAARGGFTQALRG